MQIEKIINAIPQLKEQIALFDNVFFNENMLSAEHRKMVAWAAVIATKDKASISFIKDKAGELSVTDRNSIMIASSRMATTNPYFMGRNIHPINAGGSLHSLNMTPFQQLGVKDEVGYHYACIAISLINNGLVCFSSHISSLQSSSQTDAAIDQALRLTASISAIRQLQFNSQLIN